jgi:hypothetical protein
MSEDRPHGGFRLRGECLMQSLHAINHTKPRRRWNMALSPDIDRLFAIPRHITH